MTINAQIVADSTCENGQRIVTFVLEYPRWIHAEFMTHRVFSRNAASSRAIPIDKMIQKVIDDPAMPVHWGKNQKGMQAEEQITPDQIHYAQLAWLKARDRAVESAKHLQSLGLHKQIVNRTIENFMNIKVVCTATDYDNFFLLRHHEDAQPEIRKLAECMKEAMHSSVSKFIQAGSWHLPFVTEEELNDSSANSIQKNFIRSAARCARVSYDKVDGGLSDLENDVRIFKQLVCSHPKHSSPLEHQATPSSYVKNYYNLVGWTNLRWLSDRYNDMLNEIVNKAIT